MPVKKMILKLLRLAGYDLVRWHEALDDKFFFFRNFDVRTVVDIGANRGQFAVTALRYFPKATVYSFEPLPAAFSALGEVSRQDPRIKPFNLAVSDRSGEQTIFLHSDRDDASSFLKSTETYERQFGHSRRQEEVVVKTETLDGLGASVLKDAPGEMLVKMDVQGFENRVIAGGRAFLPKASLCVAEISLVPLYEGQATFKDILEAMDGMGFDYAGNFDQVRGQDGRVIYLDALFLKRRIGD